MTIGLDLGGSTTDIVGILGGELVDPLTVRADDPVASAAGALGKFINSNNLSLQEIKHIAVTGVGMDKIKDSLLGITVRGIDEFTAIGTGGAFLSGLKDGIVVSMGTGTAIVDVEDDRISHWGGTGLGGGTLLGLSKYLLRTTDIHRIVQKASRGDLSRVDISVGDITNEPLEGLPENTTASNFGKAADEATDEDLAMAVINLVCQNIGVIAVGAARCTENETIVLTGKLATLPQMKEITDNLSTLYGKTFIIPDHAPFATAIGAALALEKKEPSP